MGSVIAVMGVAIPAILVCTNALGINEVAVIFVIYLAISGHYILPFHHLNILVGQGEENGMYTQKETVKMGVPLLIPIFFTVAFAVIWFTVSGIL
jgi:di/tricarboxylate transporter